MSNENLPEVTEGSKANEKSPLDSPSKSTSALSLYHGTIDFLSKLPEYHREILLKRWKEAEEAGVVTECFGKGMFDDSDDSSECMFWCGSEDSDGHFFCGGAFDDSSYEFPSSNSSTGDNQLGNELFLETHYNPHIFSLFKLECGRLS